MRHYGRPVEETLICYDNEYYEDINEKGGGNLPPQS